MKHTEHELDIIAERKMFIEILRNAPQKQQTTGEFWEPRKHMYCALGKYVVVTKGRRIPLKDTQSEAVERFVMKRLKLTSCNVGQVITWNDGGKLTFAEIADKFEKILLNAPIA